MRESKHRSWIPSDLNRKNRLLTLFLVSFFSPSERKVGRNRGKEGKRERIPPPFSSGIHEERKKGKSSSFPSSNPSPGGKSPGERARRYFLDSSFLNLKALTRSLATTRPWFIAGLNNISLAHSTAAVSRMPCPEDFTTETLVTIPKVSI